MRHASTALHRLQGWLFTLHPTLTTQFLPTVDLSIKAWIKEGYPLFGCREGTGFISLVQHRTNQNNQRVVTIESKSGLPVAFKGFFLQARAVSSNGTSNPVGTWDVSGANGLAKVIRLSNIPGGNSLQRNATEITGNATESQF